MDDKGALEKAISEWNKSRAKGQPYPFDTEHRIVFDCLSYRFMILARRSGKHGRYTEHVVVWKDGEAPRFICQSEDRTAGKLVDLEQIRKEAACDWHRFHDVCKTAIPKAMERVLNIAKENPDLGEFHQQIISILSS